jgi:putative membrane protein
VFALALLLFAGAFSLPYASVFSQMSEHLLLAFVVPPLLLLGVPRPLLLPIFERKWLRRLMKWATSPLRALSQFVTVLFIWYTPRLFNLTLADDRMRVLAGLSILAVAVLFWWPVVEPLPAWNSELAAMGKLLYLFAGSMVIKFLGFMLAFVPRPMYSLPVGAHLFWGFDALADQQAAGWIMLLAGMLVLLAAATVVMVEVFHEPSATPDPVHRRVR